MPYENQGASPHTRIYLSQDEELLYERMDRILGLMERRCSTLNKKLQESGIEEIPKPELDLPEPSKTIEAMLKNLGQEH